MSIGDDTSGIESAKMSQTVGIFESRIERLVTLTCGVRRDLYRFSKACGAYV